MRRASTVRLPGCRAALVGLLGLFAWLIPGAGPVQAQRDSLRAPGPELFARPPETPIEYWDAVDYLVRVGQPEQAAPYLKAFLDSNPPDDVLLEIKDRYGVDSLLRLEDNPVTRPAVEPLLEQLNAASRRRAQDPDRLRRFVATLTGTRAEQDYAVDQLRIAGPYAVPYVVEALSSPALSDEDRALLALNLGRLDRTAVPALVAVLDAEDPRLAADAADALGRMGAVHALPFLTYPAAQTEQPVVRDPARRAIERLTGRTFEAQERPPVRVLTDEARKYLTHGVEFPGTSDTVELWTWQPGTGATPRTVSPAQAEAYFGLKLARQALTLAPADRTAQTLLVALALRQAVDQVGIAAFPAQDPTGAYPLALAAGPAVLGDVLRLALAEDLPGLSAAAAQALGRVASREALITVGGGYHPLVEALFSPDRRTRFAAAEALVRLDPNGTFPGSSRVVPTLAQFVTVRTDAPRAVVIDGDVGRATQVASVLRGLGYDATTATTGKEGFRLAAGAADAELILIRPGLLDGAWGTLDTLSNLRADPATKGVPILLYGPLELRYRLLTPLENYARMAFLVEPTDPASIRPILERELTNLGARPLSAEERQAYSQSAAALLAAVARRPGSPFGPDVPAVEPALTASLSSPATALASAVALGGVPGVEAQRRLADVVLDASRPAELRLQAAGALTDSLQQFGPLLVDAQERSLLEARDAATDPALRAALSGVIGALRPDAGVISPRLRAFDPAAVLPPAQAPGEGTGTPAPAP